MRSRGGELLPCRSAARLAVDAIMATLSLDVLLTGQYIEGVTVQYLLM